MAVLFYVGLIGGFVLLFSNQFNKGHKNLDASGVAIFTTAGVASIVAAVLGLIRSYRFFSLSPQAGHALYVLTNVFMGVTIGILIAGLIVFSFRRSGQ